MSPRSLHFGPDQGIPQVSGTGFIVDERGIVLTAGHVTRSLSALPKNPTTGKHAAAAIVFSEPVRVGDGLQLRTSWVDVPRYSLLETFTTESETFYGERIPDLAFVQLGVRNLPVLSIRAEPNVIRAGMAVAFAGFPLGSDGLVLRIDGQDPMLLQMMPFLRHGIISSVHPFPCPQPHGFTIDVMSHGGASGAPIFSCDDPRVLGMLYAAIEGEHRLTYALPGHLLHWAVDAALSDGTLDVGGIPTFVEYQASHQRQDGWILNAPRT